MAARRQKGGERFGASVSDHSVNERDSESKLKYKSEARIDAFGPVGMLATAVAHNGVEGGIYTLGGIGMTMEKWRDGSGYRNRWRYEEDKDVERLGCLSCGDDGTTGVLVDIVGLD